MALENKDNPPVKPPRKISRRIALAQFRDIAKVAAIPILGGPVIGIGTRVGYEAYKQAHDDPPFFPDQPSFAPIKKDEIKDPLTNIEHVDLEGVEKLDPEYVRKVFDELKKDKGSTKDRINAVYTNLYQTSGGSTALMVDKSGIFICAGHTMGNLPEHFEPYEGFFIDWFTSPHTQKSYLIYQFMVVPESDLAIVYAPTSEDKMIVPGLTINTLLPQEGERLWAYGVYEDRTNDPMFMLRVRNGKKTRLEATEEDYYKDLFGINGLIPSGGMSGGPVVDRTGAIRGTISGTIPYDAPSSAYYTGATAASIKSSENLIRQSSPHLYTRFSKKSS